ncbi:MAG: GNAT family N-acetyltransferase, partial [Planctomycetes bacterium]|nr:GNAT family N-acetyltransferase [Planctomycetota bacterium]
KTRIELLLDQIDLAERHIDRLLRRVTHEGRAYDPIRRLLEVPGIRWIRAATFVAYIGTPWRFRNKSALFKYMGIGLERRTSGGSRPSLRVVPSVRACRPLKNMILGAADTKVAKSNPSDAVCKPPIRNILPAMNVNKNPAATMAVRMSNQAYYRQISDDETLDNGIFYFSAEHPTLDACNFVADVLIEEMGATPQAAFESIEAAFTQRGVKCCRWMPAAGQPVETLDKLLSPRGFLREETIALTRVPNPVPEVERRYHILPARAMRRACSTLLTQRFADRGEQADALLELQLSRMDDPQFDAYVAMTDDQPAGYLALHQVGEIGRIRDLYVAKSHRTAGAATALLNYALATAQRWSLRPICVEIPAGAVGPRTLLDKAGFEEGGRLVHFRAADVPELSIT